MSLAFSAKLTEQPLLHNSISLNLLFSSSKPKCLSLKPFTYSTTASIRTTEHNNRHSRTHRSSTNSPRTSVSQAPWINKWTPVKPRVDGDKKNWNLENERKQENGDGVEHKYFDGHKGANPIERIVLRLRNLGIGDEDDEMEEEKEEGGGGNANANANASGEEKLGDLLKRNWSRPDTIIEEKEDEQILLPWERGETRSRGEEGKRFSDRRPRAPTLAELTVEDVELRRLRTQGMTLRERINIPKAGVTTVIVEKIHDKWRKSELVRLKFHETLAHDMKTAHVLVERRTGGLVIWRSGSVMVVYRGINYERPTSRPQSVEVKIDAPFVPDVSSADKLTVENGNGAILTFDKTEPVLRNPAPVENLTEEEAEYSNLLDGLGPRFVDWWGTGWLPIDADLLPPTIPGYKTPFRLLPTGMRSRLTNAEMTNLRKLAKSLPSHFALGRNRNHQGLAAAIVKLWEKSVIAKIAVKRGIQNTNNKLMAEELKMLTGGTLLLRNKYYIVIFRGKDFVPTSVATALAERHELTKEIQDVEEKVRSGAAVTISVEEVEGKPLAGTLAEFREAQARWAKEMSAEEIEKMKEEAARAKTSRAINRIEYKLVVAQAKQQRAERLLAKIEASMVPVRPSDDQETITDEERFMFRRVGLKMKAYLPLGIRGVFAGVIENMHLHWKHRELVKLISKQKTLSFVEDTARLLEYESGGILVAIERVPKGYALIYYRGKNYQRPLSLRPRNLLTKAKALKRSVAMQRHEALCQHISELERNIERMQSEISNSNNLEDGDTSKDNSRLDHISEFTQNEDESSSMDSDSDEDDGDEDDDDDDDDDNDGDSDEYNENLDWEDDEE